jgi:hypothetical protein
MRMTPSATGLLRQAWKDYFSYRNHPHATSNEVERFAMAVQELKQLGWTLPQDPINWNYISALK